MPVRAAVILVQDDHVCLVRRDRDGATYYLFPGGATDPGETPAEAAAREALEELGLHVQIEHLLARMHFEGNEQLYVHATITGGTVGTGTGEDLASPRESRVGRYTPVWLPLDALPPHDVRPRQLAALLIAGMRWGVASTLDLTD